jgi:hypothetical protein
VVDDLEGHLNVLHESLPGISSVGGGVNVKLEAEAIDDSDLGRRQGVELSHALHFFELDVVAILEFVSLVLVHSHNCWVLLGDIDNDEGLGFFSILVVDHEFVSVIEEGESCGSVGCCENESDVSSSAELVDGDAIVNV